MDSDQAYKNVCNAHKNAARVRELEAEVDRLKEALSGALKAAEDGYEWEQRATAAERQLAGLEDQLAAYRPVRELATQASYDVRWAAFIGHCKDSSNKKSSSAGIGIELGERLRELASSELDTHCLKLAFWWANREFARSVLDAIAAASIKGRDTDPPKVDGSSDVGGQPPG